MNRYVLSKIGGMPVDKVGSAAVYEMLRPITLAGKHATVKVAGAAITAVLEWSRINEFRAEGSSVETVSRRLAKRAGGPKHHDVPMRTTTCGEAPPGHAAVGRLHRARCGSRNGWTSGVRDGP